LHDVNQTGAQVQLGSYEALVTVCGAWAATVSPLVMSKPMAQVLEKEPFVALRSATVVDNLVIALGRNVEDLISTGLLSKNKCDALICFKVCEILGCLRDFCIEGVHSIDTLRGCRNLKNLLLVGLIWIYVNSNFITLVDIRDFGAFQVGRFET